MPNHNFFFVRTHDRKNYVAAKYLTDASGNPIVSPNPDHRSFNLFDANRNSLGTNVNGYTIVPASFDMRAAIDFGRSVARLRAQLPPPAGPEAAASNEVAVNFAFGRAFLPWGRGWLDIQRNYNGMTGESVPAFRDGASYILGVAGREAGFPLEQIKFGGGLVNLTQRFFYNVEDASGEWGNSPQNVRSMSAGHKAQRDRIFEFARDTFDERLGPYGPPATFDERFPATFDERFGALGPRPTVPLPRARPIPSPRPRPVYPPTDPIPLPPPRPMRQGFFGEDAPAIRVGSDAPMPFGIDDGYVRSGEELDRIAMANNGHFDTHVMGDLAGIHDDYSQKGLRSSQMLDDLHSELWRIAADNIATG